VSLRLYTIGFTKKSAESFFTLLRNSGVRRLLDVRLNNVSQLAGFSKRDDLRYFLKAICGIEYAHLAVLAPTQPMLDEYKKHDHDWTKYELQFLQLMAERQIENNVPRNLLEDACLLCSEEKPSKCHRRLVAEYLNAKWGDLEIVHL
jgi:uncharacterized protein (DUF488 family)